MTLMLYICLVGKNYKLKAKRLTFRIAGEYGMLMKTHLSNYYILLPYL